MVFVYRIPSTESPILSLGGPLGKLGPAGNSNRARLDMRTMSYPQGAGARYGRIGHRNRARSCDMGEGR